MHFSGQNLWPESSDMKLPFPILREHTCMNLTCEKRVKVSVRSARIAWYILLLRLATIIVLSAIVGGTLQHMRGQTLFQTNTDVARLQYQQTVSAAEITLLRAQVAKQSDDISEMHGMGIGFAGLLLLLQIGQILLLREKKAT